MRIRLAFEPPLPPYKCWHKVDKHVNTIRDLQHSISDTFDLRAYCKSLRLDLDGFYLVPSSPVDGILQDNDIVIVKRRVKKDRETLPSLSSPSSMKRRRKDRESKSTSKRKKKTKEAKEAATPNGKSKKTTAMIYHTKGVKIDSSDNSDSDSSDSEDETTKTTNSSGSSSDSSSNSESSSSDSDSSSSSSSSTDTSDSDSDSDSEYESPGDKTGEAPSALQMKRQPPKQALAIKAANGTTVVQKQTPPFQGMTRTRKRNERRRLLKTLRQKSEGEQGCANPRQQRLLNHEPKAGTPLEPVSGQARSVSSGASATTPISTSSVLASPTRGPQDKHKGPNVFMTTSELSDRGANRSNPPPKDKSHKAQHNPRSRHPENVSTEPATEASTSTDTAASDGRTKQAVDTQPIDYEALQPLKGAPTVGSRIAYKVLEMSSSYTPVMSEFREAKVLAWDGTTRMAEVQLAPRFRPVIEYEDDGQPVLGKFEIFDQEDFERLQAGLVQLDMNSVSDCRLVEASSQ
ncbi:hypothetical protein DFQ26_006239 [Actinomortierella ambigua]|nr:hypothetical protein DFQ26_006239 [Actinomortierella ambigua]